ncbi:hypothetical protein MTBUT4_20014 [Magnetospirillum sp. UT-4]|nr:hypothetical protein MTBUT4_20014 [Magnetospirillum sp. UT-4]
MPEMAATETVIGQCFIGGPSLLSPGTYWLNKKKAGDITGIARFAKHGASFEVHQPKTVANTTEVAVSAIGIQTAVDAFNQARRKQSSSEYKEFNLDKLLGIDEYQNALATNRARLRCDLQMPTIAEISYPEDWQWLAETVLDGDTCKWVSKTMNTTGDNEIAKAVHAGTDRNLVNFRVSNNGFHVLDALCETVVASQLVQAPIGDELFQATYSFQSKDLPGALSAIKALLPDSPVVMSIAARAIRLRAEQDDTVAEFLVPTLVNGTRYPKAAKLGGFVTEDEPENEQDVA